MCNSVLCLDVPSIVLIWDLIPGPVVRRGGARCHYTTKASACSSHVPNLLFYWCRKDCTALPSLVPSTYSKIIFSETVLALQNPLIISLALLSALPRVHLWNVVHSPGGLVDVSWNRYFKRRRPCCIDKHTVNICFMRKVKSKSDKREQTRHARVNKGANFSSWKYWTSSLPLVCNTAVISVVTQRSYRRGALRDDTNNGCVADNPPFDPFWKFKHFV